MFFFYCFKAPQLLSHQNRVIQHPWVKITHGQGWCESWSKIWKLWKKIQYNSFVQIIGCSKKNREIIAKSLLNRGIKKSGSSPRTTGPLGKRDSFTLGHPLNKKMSYPFVSLKLPSRIMEIWKTKERMDAKKFSIYLSLVDHESITQYSIPRTLHWICNEW